DTGAFVRGENAYSIVKCAFKDNVLKPKTVTDVKLSVNILDSELISPIFHYQVTVEYLVKDLIAKHIIDSIDKVIEQVKDERIDQGEEELSDGEVIFTKLNKVEVFTDDDTDNPKSKRYTFMAKTLMERLTDLRAEIDPESFDALNIRENIKKIIDMENIRNRGFNTAINSITAILDTSKMGYQYIENLKNGREVIIREYEDTDLANLPDERYGIKMRYFDNAQLIEDRKAYDVMLKSFETEVQHLWDVLEVIYQDKKSFFKINDFGDLAKRSKGKIRKNIKEKTGEPLYEDIAKVWDEISFIKAAETEVEKSNRTYVFEKDRIRNRIILMRNKMKQMYDYLYPVERRVMEDRLAWLEKEYYRFDYMINPYHLQPGILLDVDITSIKRKKATLDAMANVLNEFLHGVSKGFQDAAFASFSRRRSTVREDINQSFAAVTEVEEEQEAAAPAPRPRPAAIAAPKAKPKAKAKAAPKKKGVVDSRAKAKKGGRGGIAEL
ncbi:MAG: cytochrome C oxidase subunit II, partial [Treponema sp.]|nr:cytochrome C oxidase subunit II [Treponema sp.]